MKNTAEHWIQRYNAIWDKFEGTDVNSTSKSDVPLLQRGFVFQFDANIKSPDIVFMGINPSYPNEKENFRTSYTKEDVKDHAYFKVFGRMETAWKTHYRRNFTWTHIDALVFRETQQRFIREKLFKAESGPDFIMEQLAVSRELLEYFNPKILVVSNTMAQELLGKNKAKDNSYGVWMGLEFEFLPKLGTHRIVNSGKLDGTIVFFTSMLSGQRALDLGSRERLIWHIDKAFTYILEGEHTKMLPI